MKQDITEVDMKIDELIKDRKYDEALELGKNFPTDAHIQFRMMIILLNMMEHEQALEIGSNFPEDAMIQSIVVKVLRQKGKDENGTEYSGKLEKLFKKFKDDPVIQSQHISILIGKKEFKEAEEIGELFREDLTIQSQMIIILIKQEKYDEAFLFISELEKENTEAKKFEAIQSQKMTLFIKKGQFEDALKLAEEQPKCKPIQSQAIQILLKLERIEELKAFLSKLGNDIEMNSKAVQLLFKKTDFLKEVLDIGEKFPEDEQIQYYVIKALVINGRTEQAREIAKRFPKSQQIKIFIAGIDETEKNKEEEKVKKRSKEEAKASKRVKKRAILRADRLLRKIKEKPDSVEVARIITANKDDLLVMSILQVAVLDSKRASENEKRNLGGALESRKKYIKDEAQKAKLRRLLNKLNEKIGGFDKNFYLELLDGLEIKTPIDNEIINIFEAILNASRQEDLPQIISQINKQEDYKASLVLYSALYSKFKNTEQIDRILKFLNSHNGSLSDDEQRIKRFLEDKEAEFDEELFREIIDNINKKEKLKNMETKKTPASPGDEGLR